MANIMFATPTLYHLISRFVAGEWFIDSDHERTAYLQLLGDALKHSDWKCLAYAIMSNHIHFAMIAGRSPRRSWMSGTHSPFGEWMNRRHDRFGAVFAKGISTSAIHPDDLTAVIAYIHNNPVRAGIASKASDSAWTSHRAYLGFDKPPRWLHVDRGFELMRISDPHVFDQRVRAEVSRPRIPRRKRGRPFGS